MRPFMKFFMLEYHFEELLIRTDTVVESRSHSLVDYDIFVSKYYSSLNDLNLWFKQTF